MPYWVAFVFAVMVGQGFALPHHAMLSVRTRAAASRGAPGPASAKQRDLVRLQAGAAVVLAFAVAIRAALGGDAVIAFTWGGPLFGSVFAAGVYFYYPEAAMILAARDSRATSPSTRRLGVVAWGAASVLFLGIVVAAR